MLLVLFLAQTCFAATLQRMDLPESEYPGLLTISLLKTLHSSTLISPFSFTVTFIFEDTCFTLIFTFTFKNTALYRQPIAVSDISIYICLINIRDGSSKPVYGGVDRLQALSSAKTGCRSRFFMN